MFPIESFRKTLQKFVEILRKHEIPFHLTGGVTGAAYGEPRFTQDIDIVLQNKAVREQLDGLILALSNSEFIFNEQSMNLAVENQKMFQLFDSVEALKLDVYPRELIPGELGRSREVEIFPDVWLPIVSRFDAAASKLVWIHRGSHKSRRDLRQIVLGKETVLQQLNEFAKDAGLSKLLTDVLSETDEIVE